jgi:twitching motility protein PilT
MAHLDALFRAMVEARASDLHISSEEPPRVRVDGSMRSLGPNPISRQQMWELLKEICPAPNWAEFEERRDTDFAYEIEGLGRFRSNFFRDLKGPGAVFRLIPSKILSAEELGLPEAILGLCRLHKGLVLVTGPTGSGKSTTLCAMVDYINRTRDDHIITIEDPVEFVHPNKKCLVNQREVGTHANSFKSALRAALREDPDIILCGELRDLETVHIALEMAETGHLVFGTLHTNTAASTVDRLVDQFPADQQEQIRTMLAGSLKGVIAQTLLKKKGGKGRVAAMEILLMTNAVQAYVREGKSHQIPMAMQTGRGLGMIELGAALLDLVKRDQVEPEEAWSKAIDKDTLVKEMARHGVRFVPPGTHEEPATGVAAAPVAGAGAGRASGASGAIDAAAVRAQAAAAAAAGASGAAPAAATGGTGMWRRPEIPGAQKPGGGAAAGAAGGATGTQVLQQPRGRWFGN